MQASYYFVSSGLVKESFFEDFSYHLFNAGCEGIEEDGKENSKTRFKVYWTEVESMKIYQVFSDLKEALPTADVELTEIETHESKDWRVCWRENFEPLEVGKNMLIRAPWHLHNSSKKNIVIDPGRSFGTGYHASTSLALILLEQFFEEKKIDSLIDVGTGSGILAIASALLGVQNIRAFEIDDSFLEEVPNNCKHSEIFPETIRLYSNPFDEFEGTADLITANITVDVLTKLKTSFIRCLNPGGYLILSGVYELFQEEFEREFSQSFTIIRREILEEWRGYLLKPIFLKP